MFQVHGLHPADAQKKHQQRLWQNNNDNNNNHNYNKILKSDCLSTALISALTGQLNRTVRVMPK